MNLGEGERQQIEYFVENDRKNNLERDGERVNKNELFGGRGRQQNEFLEGTRTRTNREI